MEVTAARPSTEAAQLIAASLQNVRFKERRLREAQSDVRSDVVYFSPVIRIDSETQSAIIQYRDGLTGEVQREYPPGEKYGAYRDVDVEMTPVQQGYVDSLEVEPLTQPVTPEGKQPPTSAVDETV